MTDINKKLKELGYEPLFEEENNDPNTFVNLAERIGYNVPEDYQQFLLDYPNTGTFSFIIELPIIDKVVATNVGDHLSVGLLHAACKTVPSYNLLNGREYEAISPDLLVIGDGSFGNYFCLCLKKESFGKVYYLDHETYIYDQGQELDEVEGLYLVANDFTSFICNLRIDPDSN